MIKATLKLDKRRKLNNGKYPLKIKIARKDTSFYLGTSYELNENEWDADACKVKLRADKKTINLKLEKRLTSIKEKILALQEAGQLRYYTNAKLRSFLLNEDDHDMTEHLFRVQFEDFLSSKTSKNTNRIYTTTKVKIQGFCDYDALILEEIDINWLDRFVAHLKDEGNQLNTIAIRLRNIRAVLNHARRKKIIKEVAFSNYRIKTEETKKRSLSIHQLRKFYFAELDKDMQACRDMFFLTFFLMGINLVDLSSLTTIEDGRIKYKRAKTGTLYDIKVEPEAQAIIDKYKGEKRLISLFEKYKDYVYLEHKFERTARRFERILSIPRISLYWARHSFATIAYELGISTDVIADCLGHKTGHKITEIYIKKDQRRVDEANRKVIDYVLYDKK